MTWFEQLFGFPEADYTTTQSRFTLTGRMLTGPNGRGYDVGVFSTPNLAELRAKAQRVGRSGELFVSHQAIGDVLELHARPENRGAMFQVASQLNCLEFASPTMVPEDGITVYAHDPTQGPACSLAAGAATVYRNYFASVQGQIGQTHDRQISTISDLSSILGGETYTVRNGYTHSSESQLSELADRMKAHDRDALLDSIRIGVQTQVEVTSKDRLFRPPSEPTFVSQAFCSAISCGYVKGVASESWRPLATLVLDAAYEATLWAAVCDRAEGHGSGRVWLTFLGGGVFDNNPEWIAAAIGRALHKSRGFALDVRIAHHRAVSPRMKARVERLTG